ncbi:MAG: peptidase U62 [Acidobacteriota bacterium]|nr:peptidase U62 [Acidobacteriota bacterium]
MGTTFQRRCGLPTAFPKSRKRSGTRIVLCLVLILICFPWRSVTAAPRAGVLLETMQSELRRAMASLAKTDPAPYYVSYAVTDSDLAAIAANNGALILSTRVRRRQAGVTMHVGAAALDNTHGQSRASGLLSALLPLDNDRDAIARVLWQLTSNEYERASSAFLRVKTNYEVQSPEEDKSPDFSRETPQRHIDETKLPLTFEQEAWEDRIRKVSAEFVKFPEVYTSVVTLQSGSGESYLATSEGTAIVQPSAISRLVMQAETRADDGMVLLRVESFEQPSLKNLPSESDLVAKADKMAADLKALRAAPAAEPYAGPALLSGRAAAVFFHEVLGHRLEGHRQRDEREGQTFTKKVGELVLPSFLSVVDDPTIKELSGVKLAGSYDYDDEGTPAERVVAVQDGVLKNFLMSRIPITGFAHSNGHGRAQEGFIPTGRQGNLIVTSTKTVTDGELRRKFIEEIKSQGKPYGLYFEDIQGGFTLTSRAAPQAFEIIPVMVWRVYADGRPDELVRGTDIVGTPLLSLNKIILTGDKLETFNGICGAESGQVPVSASAPAMLFSEIEVQKSAKGAERPPILPPPGFGDTWADAAGKKTAEVVEAKP